MAIQFKHVQTGLVKKSPEGFSFTYMFFGPLVAILRGMWTPFFASFFTFGLANFYYMFKINKSYSASLLERGFVPDTDEDRLKLEKMGLLQKSAEAVKAAI